MTSQKTCVFRCGSREWRFPGRPLIMGVLNLTPDSFSDGGRFATPAKALQQAHAMIAAGADIIDLGGESTRPGAETVPSAEEIRRVLPVVRALAGETAIPISIDTRKAPVAAAALAAGASIVNDISGLHCDPEMIEVVRDSQAGAVLMHMRGTPQNMQQFTAYHDLTGEIRDYFLAIMERTRQAGIAGERLILDPGIGFSKTAEQNLQIIAELPRLADLGRPLLLGPSRKSFIGKLLDLPDPADRGSGTLGALAVAVWQGAGILRVHEVQAAREAAIVAAAIRDSRP